MRIWTIFSLGLFLICALLLGSAVHQGHLDFTPLHLRLTVLAFAAWLAVLAVRWMKYVLALLAVAGMVLSGLALQVHYSTDIAPCSINEKWDCGIVNHSPFAEIAHVPVAAIGLGGYLLLGVLALFRRRAALVVLAVGALGYSLYLTRIEKYVLEVWCLYCVISLGVIVLFTLLSTAWLFAAVSARERA